MGLLDLWRRRRAEPGGVVLALGGGGARGVAHMGVLARLEAEGIAVAGIAGTSAGAVLGAMWLALGGAAAVEARWRELLASGLLPDSLPDTRLSDDISSRDNFLLHFARRLQQGATIALAVEKRSLIRQDELSRVLAFLLPDVSIERLSRPFAAVATEFVNGRVVALRQGSLRAAVAASSAVPGVVPPFVIDTRAYVDGGVVADVPVRQARELSPRPVVAVDAGDLPGGEDPARLTVPRALLRAGVLTHQALREELLRDADVVLRPAVQGIHWSEFGRFEEALAAGREAAQAQIGRLREAARPAAVRKRPARG